MASDFDMKRKPWLANPVTVALTADSTSPVIDMSRFAGGGYVITAAVTAATFSFWGAACKNTKMEGSLIQGTLGQIFDLTNTAVTQAITNGNAYVFPDQCFPFPFIQIRCDAGTATIELSKKS